MKCRIAKHTHDISTLSIFYQKILGCTILGKFQDHNGYDGVFIGFKDDSWHLEFTQSKDPFEKVIEPDDLLALYPSPKEFESIISKIESHTIQMIKTKNPYWNTQAICIQDPDGNIICIQKPK